MRVHLARRCGGLSRQANRRRRLSAQDTGAHELTRKSAAVNSWRCNRRAAAINPAENALALARWRCRSDEVTGDLRLSRGLSSAPDLTPTLDVPERHRNAVAAGTYPFQQVT